MTIGLFLALLCAVTLASLVIYGLYRYTNRNVTQTGLLLVSTLHLVYDFYTLINDTLDELKVPLMNRVNEIPKIFIILTYKYFQNAGGLPQAVSTIFKVYVDQSTTTADAVDVALVAAKVEKVYPKFQAYFKDHDVDLKQLKLAIDYFFNSQKFFQFHTSIDEVRQYLFRDQDTAPKA